MNGLVIVLAILGVFTVGTILEQLALRSERRRNEDL